MPAWTVLCLNALLAILLSISPAGASTTSERCLNCSSEIDRLQIDIAALEASIRDDERRLNPPALLDFTARVYRARTGNPFKPFAHQATICDALERVANGECKRLIINVPPSSGKTELANNFIAWCMGRWPDAEFIYASYSDALATANAATVRAIMQHESYAEIFGAPQFRRDSNAKGEFRTVRGGCVYAAGTDGTLTGYHAGKMRDGFGGAIFIDDAMKANEAQSKAIRQRTVDWFRGTMESRPNSPSTPVIVIGQRLHVVDLPGWLLAGGNGEQWEHVCIRSLDEFGASFCPELYPVERLERIRAGQDVEGIESTGSFVFDAQYQQQPKRLGGNIIKGEWFPRYTMPPKIRWRAIFADTASKTKTANDYTVFGCYGLGEDGKLYLLDVLRGKWEAMALETRAVDFWVKHAALAGEDLGPLRYLKCEDASSGTGLIQTLRTKGHATIIGIKHDRDKFSRLHDVLGFLESRRVAIPQSAPWVSDFVAECEAMTADNSHAHDDQVDTLTDAIKDMLAKRREWSTIG